MPIRRPLKSVRALLNNPHYFVWVTFVSVAFWGLGYGIDYSIRHSDDSPSFIFCVGIFMEICLWAIALSCVTFSSSRSIRRRVIYGHQRPLLRSIITTDSTFARIFFFSLSVNSWWKRLLAHIANSLLVPAPILITVLGVTCAATRGANENGLCQIQNDYAYSALAMSWRTALLASIYTMNYIGAHNSQQPEFSKIPNTEGGEGVPGEAYSTESGQHESSTASQHANASQTSVAIPYFTHMHEIQDEQRNELVESSYAFNSEEFQRDFCGAHAELPEGAAILARGGTEHHPVIVVAVFLEGNSQSHLQRAESITKSSDFFHRNHTAGECSRSVEKSFSHEDTMAEQPLPLSLTPIVVEGVPIACSGKQSESQKECSSCKLAEKEGKSIAACSKEHLFSTLPPSPQVLVDRLSIIGTRPSEKAHSQNNSRSSAILYRATDTMMSKSKVRMSQSTSFDCMAYDADVAEDMLDLNTCSVTFNGMNETELVAAVATSPTVSFTR